MADYTRLGWGQVANQAAPSRPFARAAWVWPALIGIVLCVTAGAIAAAPRQYTTTAVVSVTPRQAESPPAASMITLLAKSYVAFASSDQTAEKIALATGVPVADIQRGTTVTMPANTTNVQVQATMGSPGEAALVAGAMSTRLVAFSEYDPTLSATTVVPASPPPDPELARLRPLTVEALGFLGVAALVLALVARAAQRRTRIRSEL